MHANFRWWSNWKSLNDFSAELYIFYIWKWNVDAMSNKIFEVMFLKHSNWDDWRFINIKMAVIERWELLECKRKLPKSDYWRWSIPQARIVRDPLLNTQAIETKKALTLSPLSQRVYVESSKRIFFSAYLAHFYLISINKFHIENFCHWHRIKLLIDLVYLFLCCRLWMLHQKSEKKNLWMTEIHFYNM